MTTEFDTEWARILADVPLAAHGQKIPQHHPFRVNGSEDVYTMREQKGCQGCVFDYVAVAHGKERDRRERLCTRSPNCAGYIVKLFEPSDYTIMVARGDTDEP